MKRTLAAAALALAIPALAAAQGAPQYSAEQILEHFSPADAAATGTVGLPKRNTRAVCIGTASECAQHEAAVAADPQDAGGFDLLITFEFGSDRLSEQARVNLTEFARAMRDPALASAGFNVDGHTDAVGSDAFNQALSERRAASVVEYLESLGIDRSRLTAQGHGESALRDPANPDAGINRRVEATLRAR